MTACKLSFVLISVCLLWVDATLAQPLWRVVAKGTRLLVAEPFPAGTPEGSPCQNPVAVYSVLMAPGQADRLALALPRMARALMRENGLTLFDRDGEVLAIFATANEAAERAASGVLAVDAVGAGWFCPPADQTPLAFAQSLLAVMSEEDSDDDSLNTGKGGDCTNGGLGAHSCSITCGSSSCSVGCQSGFYACCKCSLFGVPSCRCHPI